MKCKWYQRWLMVSADDELRGWRTAWLHSHLSTCARCAADLARMRRLRELVASRKAEYAATLDHDQFWGQLQRRLREPQQPAEPRGVALFGYFPTSRLAFAAAAVAVCIAVLIGIRFNQDAQHTSTVAMEIPPLSPPGENNVQFSDVKATPETWAGVVKFDQPGVDITVIWVNGQEELKK